MAVFQVFTSALPKAQAHVLHSISTCRCKLIFSRQKKAKRSSRTMTNIDAFSVTPEHNRATGAIDNHIKGKAMYVNESMDNGSTRPSHHTPIPRIRLGRVHIGTSISSSPCFSSTLPQWPKIFSVLRHSRQSVPVAMTWITSVLFIVFFFGSVVVSSERTFDVLPWSSDACATLGDDHIGVFDLCATLEFCEGAGNENEHHHHDHHKDVRRQLRSRQVREDWYRYEKYYDEESFHGEKETYGKYEDQRYNGGSGASRRAARYGFRIGASSNSQSSFDCNSPGPLIRVKRGKRYGLFLRNAGKPNTVTNLHTHGLHIAGTGNADDVTREVVPGETMIYNLTIPSYHMGGTFFYHSHHHGKVLEQVSGGAFGMLIVEDQCDFGTEDHVNCGDIGTFDQNVLQFLQNERLLIVDNIHNNKYVANGVIAEGGDTYHLYRHEWYRLRILMVDIAHTSSVALNFGEECEARAVAQDGIFRFHIPAEAKSKYFLRPSSRLDVSLRCRESSVITVDEQFPPLVTLVVHDHDDNHVLSSSSLGEAHPNATPFLAGSAQWKSYRPTYLSDMTQLSVNNRFEVTVNETSINEVHFNLSKPLCNHGGDFQYDTVNEWMLTGTSEHPLHVHAYPMQVIEGCGPQHDVGEFYDTISAVRNNGYGDSKSSWSTKELCCLVRLRFVDVGGHIMLHCHIFHHEDMGSMGFIHVLGGPVQPSDLNVLHCEGGRCDVPSEPTRCTQQDDVFAVVKREENGNINW